MGEKYREGEKGESAGARVRGRVGRERGIQGDIVRVRERNGNKKRARGIEGETGERGYIMIESERGGRYIRWIQHFNT